MKAADLRSAAIEKLKSLSPDDALKVFIFMAGLEAGLKDNPKEEGKKADIKNGNICQNSAKSP